MLYNFCLNPYIDWNHYSILLYLMDDNPIPVKNNKRALIQSIILRNNIINSLKNEKIPKPLKLTDKIKCEKLC